MKRIALFGAHLIALSIALIHPVATQANGSISIAPKRVVFSPRDRAAEVTLYNQGDTLQTYRMAFKELAMDQLGKLTQLEGDTLPSHAASSMVRFSPRQVSIPPGGSQTIRLMLRKPADLAPGEYRSHAQFIGLPDSSQNDVEGLQADEGTVSVRMRTVYGISIPIIVRHGKGDASAIMGNLSLSEGNDAMPRPHATLTLQREGEHSLHGGIQLVHQASDGKDYLIGKMLGISLYTTAQQREVKIPLKVRPSTLRGGKVVARFSSDKRYGTANAQTELTLN